MRPQEKEKSDTAPSVASTSSLRVTSKFTVGKKWLRNQSLESIPALSVASTCLCVRGSRSLTFYVFQADTAPSTASTSSKCAEMSPSY